MRESSGALIHDPAAQRESPSFRGGATPGRGGLGSALLYRRRRSESERPEWRQPNRDGAFSACGVGHGRNVVECANDPSAPSFGGESITQLNRRCFYLHVASRFRGGGAVQLTCARSRNGTMA